MPTKRTVLVAALGAAMLLIGAGCGSSKPKAAPGAPNTAPAGNATRSITVGVLTDLTGPAASGDKTFLNGVRAGVAMAKRECWTINLVVGDAETSLSVALTVAQKMVEQDHVPIVLAQSSLTFAAAPYLMSHDVPVIGAAEDAGEWGTDLNMFPIGGALHISAVTSTLGQLFKLLGASRVGALGYGISPSSADSARGAVRSAQAAGLKGGYLNPTFPFGSTNVQPVALAMKNAGVDAFYASVDPNTGFSLIQSLAPGRS